MIELLSFIGQCKNSHFRTSDKVSFNKLGLCLLLFCVLHKLPFAYFLLGVFLLPNIIKRLLLNNTKGQIMKSTWSTQRHALTANQILECRLHKERSLKRWFFNSTLKLKTYMWTFFVTKKRKSYNFKWSNFLEFNFLTRLGFEPAPFLLLIYFPISKI